MRAEGPKYFLGVPSPEWKELADEAEEKMFDLTPGCHLLGIHPSFLALKGFLIKKPFCSIECIYLDEPTSLLDPLNYSFNREAEWHSSDTGIDPKIRYYSLYSWIEDFFRVPFSDNWNRVIDREKIVPIILPPIYQSPELSAIISLMADYLRTGGVDLDDLRRRHQILSVTPDNTDRLSKIREQVGFEVSKVYRSLL